MKESLSQSYYDCSCRDFYHHTTNMLSWMNQRCRSAVRFRVTIDHSDFRHHEKKMLDFTLILQWGVYLRPSLRQAHMVGSRGMLLHLCVLHVLTGLTEYALAEQNEVEIHALGAEDLGDFLGIPPDPTGANALRVASIPLNVLLVVDCTNAGRSAFPGHERMWLGLGSRLHDDGHNVTVRDPPIIFVLHTPVTKKRYISDPICRIILPRD
eukprot:185178-Pyramimonas_sp.AAC.2